MAFRTVYNFPNIDQFESVSATLNHGVTPSVISCTIAPQIVTVIPLNGDFVITYIDTDGVEPDVQIRFKNCQVDSASYQFNQSGETTTIRLLDYRYSWREELIYGRYNVKKPDGTLAQIIGAEKTPRELASLIFDKLSVATYDVTALPNDTRPYVNWESGANAAAELQKLCADLNCVIVPALDGSVKIAALGVGATFPAGQYESTGQRVSPINKPKELKLVGNPIQCQIDFTLRPVGEDLDGTIKPINDLSYKPVPESGAAIDWTSIDLKKFHSINDPKAKMKARRTVFRWFQIENPVHVTDAGSGFSAAMPLPSAVKEQWLPLISEQNEFTVVDGSDRPREAMVFGRWHSKGLTGLNSIDDVANLDPEKVDEDHAETIVPFSFSIDNELGIVKFSRAVYAINSTTGDIEVPDLFLRCCARYRILADWGFAVGTVTRPIEVSSLGTRNVVREDIQPRATWKARTGPPIDNAAYIEDQMNYYLDELEKEYNLNEIPEVRTYGHIINVPLDGAIRSITWNCSASGSSTEISWNDDRGTLLIPPYKVRQERILRLQAVNEFRQGRAETRRHNEKLNI
jgi:hypothetical protein